MKRVLLLGIAIVAVSGCGGNDNNGFGGNTGQDIQNLRTDVDDLRTVANQLRDELNQQNPSLSRVDQLSQDLMDITSNTEQSSEDVIADAQNCSR